MMRSALTTLFAFGIAFAETLPEAPKPPAPPAPVQERTFPATYLGGNSTFTEIRLDEAGRVQGLLVAVASPSLLPLVKALSPGDRIAVRVSMKDGQAPQLLDLRARPLDPQVAAAERWLVMAASGLALGLAVFLLTWGKPICGLLVGQDNRYSNSKTQFTLWFGVFGIAYLSALYLRWTHGISVGFLSVPQNLLMLSGLSGLTLVSAKALTDKKLKSTPAAKDGGTPTFPEDLAQNDSKQFDLGDFQMILITCIAAVTYLCQVYSFLGDLTLTVRTTLPDVDGTLLAAFGLGQGTYLAKKSLDV